MLEKLVEKRKIITSVFGCVLLVLWLITLFVGTGDDKTEMLIVTPVLAVVVYGFIRLLFKVVGKNAPQKYMTFFSRFFLLGGSLGIIVMLIEFVTKFPDGLSPTIGGCMGLIVGVLAEANKHN